MNERAHIGYHLGYASLNIFLIWIPKLNRVIRTREVVLKDELYKSRGRQGAAFHRAQRPRVNRRGTAYGRVSSW